MKKITHLYKNGTKYQVGEVTKADLTAVETNLSNLSGDVTTNTSHIPGLTKYTEKQVSNKRANTFFIFCCSPS